MCAWDFGHIATRTILSLSLSLSPTSIVMWHFIRWRYDSMPDYRIFGASILVSAVCKSLKKM